MRRSTTFPRRGTTLLVILLLNTVASCRESDAPIGPGAGGNRLYVESDPQGARVFVDDRDQGIRTPDTVRVTTGEHALRLRLDTAGFRYEFNALLRVPRSDSVGHVNVPLTMQCLRDAPDACYASGRRYREAGGMRFGTNAIGALFFWNGSGLGLFWPATTSNSYTSNGMPVLAGLANGSPVALGVYDQPFLAGRPAPEIRSANGTFELTQTLWIIPPLHQLIRPTTVRGIEIVEHLTASDALPGVMLLKLTFRNISHQLDYNIAAPHLPRGPVTYTDTYIGFALDADIGDATEDWLSYDAELDMVFAYDAHFNEPLFTTEAISAPAVLGLRVLRRPAGTNVVLNGWVNRTGSSGDWYAGTATEQTGFNVLTGRTAYLPEHPDPEIGHLPTGHGDARITVTAGPLTLAPGSQAEIVIALALAAPAPGTYTPGVLVEPGEPTSTTRALYRIVAPLRERMRAAEALNGREDE